MIVFLSVAAISQGQSNVCDVLKAETVKVESAVDSGAGIVMQTNGKIIYVATAAHVVKGRRIVMIRFPTVSTSATVLYPKDQETTLDVAILRAELPPQIARIPRVQIATDPLASGQRVTYLGHPGELGWQCYPNKEVISRLSVEGDERRFFFTNPVTLRGLSGGPVTDQYGRLIGLISSQSPSANAIAVRISSVIRILADEMGVVLAPPETPPARTVRTEPVVSAEAKADVSGFQFELKQCSASRTSVTCKVSIVSPKRDRTIRLGDWYGRTSFFDQDGSEYHHSGVTIANKHGNDSVETLLVRDLPVQAEFTFKVTGNVTAIPLLKIRGADKDNNTFLDIQFRNIRPQTSQ